jgi:Carboxypeptidase regulatory-like domain
MTRFDIIRTTPRSNAALVLALLLGATSSLAAQQSFPGIVRDELGQPIAGAEVVVGRAAQKVVTDAEGRFVVNAVSPGINYLTARASGTLPTVDLLRFQSNAPLEIILDRFTDVADSASELAARERVLSRVTPLYATASANARTGVAITAREISQRSPGYTSDLFREIVGYRVAGAGPTAYVYTSGGSCMPTIVLDGSERVGMRLNEIAVSSIKLLVAYNAYSVLPPDLRVLRVDSACGMVSITSK